MRTLAIISNQAFSLVNFRGSLIRYLAGKGVRVYALAPDYDESLRTRVRECGAEPVDFSLARAGMNPGRDCLDACRLAMLLRRLRPDVTLGYFVKPVIYGTLAAWLARVPRRVAMIEGLGYVYSAVGEELTWKRHLLRAATSRLYRSALARAHRVVFLNSDDLSEFQRHGLVDADKAFRLGGIGVDLMQWTVAAPVGRPVTFLLAARLLREKGIVEFVEAARIVRRQYPDTRFILLGGLDENPGGLARSEVESWAREGLIEWPGHVDVRPWLAQASVFVLPSYYREGVPRSTQEAMAMGRPVITTDAPGCRETVCDGLNGYLVPARDAEQLAMAMKRFLVTPEIIESMGKASRKLAEERFDAQRINARLFDVLFS